MENEKKLIVVRPGKLKRIIRYTVAIGASLLLIFLLIVVYNFYTLSPDRLFKETFIAYELSGKDSASPIENAYREKKFAEVIRLNRSSVLSIKDVFLTGMAYLETRDYAKAASTFQVVVADIRDESSELKDAAEYYLALAYLQNSDYDQAIEQMNSIRNNSSHLYKDRFSSKFINRVKRLKWR